MAYKNKVYVAFDGDEDMDYYHTLQMWSENEKIDFDLKNAHDLKSSKDTSTEETIKRSLRERMNNSKTFILLVGKKTKNLFKYVKWEIEVAIKLELPIIVVNVNGNKQVDDLMPPLLRNQLSIVIPYKLVAIKYALDKWPEADKMHRKNGEIKQYRYADKVYENLHI